MTPISISIHPNKDLDSSVEPQFFTLRELCYTKLNEDNTPTTFTQVANLRALADFLDEIRLQFGYPIWVNSAFRTPKVNALVGGSPHSLHKQGRACDVWCASDHVDELIEILRKNRNQMCEFIVNKDKHYIHCAI